MKTNLPNFFLFGNKINVEESKNKKLNSMEGPSLKLASEQLSPFEGQIVLQVDGNSKQPIITLLNQKINKIFSYGKYLFFQFDTFALRVHFLLFGSFEATVNGTKVTGDYPKKERPARLKLTFKNGIIEMYSCSIVFVEDKNVKKNCDFSIDTISPSWNKEKALKKVLEHPEEEIADVLLDQTIFMGVGNIIKNETLLLAKISPLKKVSLLSPNQISTLIDIIRKYVFQFYEWRKEFILKKHYRIYRQSYCKQCGNKVLRKKTGVRKRMSFICLECQK